MAGNIPAAGGPGSYDQPIPLSILYHTFNKNAIPFRKLFYYLQANARLVILYAKAVASKNFSFLYFWGDL